MGQGGARSRLPRTMFLMANHQRRLTILWWNGTEERDDLKSLLQATLQRLETVDEVLHHADISTAMMEQKVTATNPPACLHQSAGGK